MTSPQVRVHLHYAMTGSYPLRLVDLLFFDDRVILLEYDYLTGFDLATAGADRRAASFAETLESEGLAAARAAAEREQRIDYDGLDRIVVYDGGAVAREKVVLERTDAAPVRVRVHGGVEADGLCAALESTVASDSTAIDRQSGAGVSDRFRRLCGLTR
ncbi:MAG: hypothetical protein ABEI27_01030 [Halobellus sp.]|uniref:hypothetical protein n=1 Tax=Halobellus sp. TaxID=1979212 RepID=UPI0035D4D8AC